jgi:hypothetical protein
MSGQDGSTNDTSESSLGITPAPNLPSQRADNNPHIAQELEELKAKVKALEEMVQIEGRTHSNQNRKRARTDEHLTGQSDSFASYQDSSIRSTTEHSSLSDSSEIIYHPRKRLRHSYARGIKVTPSYTLKASSSLREWGDWKRDIERVFEGDPQTYQSGSQKILKALDYLDASLKSLWYTYHEQKGGVRRWHLFVTWTRNNVQNGQNATATLYEQLNSAKQLPDRSPIQFNAYLSAIERDLPQQDEKASAMTFYSKLTREMKRQFQTSDIAIPKTRAQCVAVAQRVWQGLHGTDRKDPRRDTRPGSSSYDRERENTSSKYPRPDSRRDRRDRYRTSHRKDERYNDEKPKKGQLDVTCYNCREPGHYATSCPKPKEHKERRSEAKIQAVQQYDTDASHSPSPTPSTRTGSEEPIAHDTSSESSN